MKVVCDATRFRNSLFKRIIPRSCSRYSSTRLSILAQFFIPSCQRFSLCSNCFVAILHRSSRSWSAFSYGATNAFRFCSKTTSKLSAQSRQKLIVANEVDGIITVFGPQNVYSDRSNLLRRITGLFFGTKYVLNPHNLYSEKSNLSRRIDKLFVCGCCTRFFKIDFSGFRSVTNKINVNF